MITSDDAEALRRRIESDGWNQGSLVPWRFDLFLAKPGEALTAEADRISGSGDVAAAFERKREPYDRMIVISQRCDLVASPTVEPLVEAMPVVTFTAENLPGLNSTRYFVLDEQKRLVVDGSRRLLFEKTLLPSAAPTQLISSDEQRSRLAAWCARRYTRVPFADDFVATVGYALEDAIKRSGRGKPGYEALHSWRVVRTEDGGGTVSASFLVPYDEDDVHAAEVPGMVAAIVERAQRTLPRYHAKALERAAAMAPSPTIRPHEIVSVQALPTGKVSLRMLRKAPAFNLEHLTYAGEPITGIEPHEETLA